MTINHEALKKRRAGSRMGAFGWKAKEGTNKVRILPPHSKFIGQWDQMLDLSTTFRIHYFRVEGRQIEVSRCLEDLKQRCPACEMYRVHKKSTDPGLVELAKSVRANDQYLFNILDINNLQAGIQAWPANYTCWDKIMEIAANPAWGNVVDPANGVNFDVTMTPGNRSRTGHNQYSVTPEPQRTTVQAVLDSIEDWQGKMDSLDEHMTPVKELEEIETLLDEMGFPPLGGRPRGPGGQPLPIAVPSAQVGGVGIPGVASAPTIIQPVPVAAPVGAPKLVLMPSEPTSGAARAAEETASALGGMLRNSSAAATPVHYDPGPNYTPKVPSELRPEGAPRCYGDYAPTVHRCQPCPVLVDCQLQMLGVK